MSFEIIEFCFLLIWQRRVFERQGDDDKGKASQNEQRDRSHNLASHLWKITFVSRIRFQKSSKWTG